MKTSWIRYTFSAITTCPTYSTSTFIRPFAPSMFQIASIRANSWRKREKEQRDNSNNNFVMLFLTLFAQKVKKMEINRASKRRKKGLIRERKKRSSREMNKWKVRKKKKES